jgi:filamentous hemagglutinin family protein
MKRMLKIFKKHFFREITIYLLVYCLIFNTSMSFVLADVVLQPDGVINGNITVTPLGGGTTEMTATDGAIGHFSDFDIAEDQFVNCIQPSAGSNALFRVFSGDGTQILGRFDATGNIFLVDSAGIYFGANAQVNVNQLIASSLDISNENFLAGNYEFIAGSGNVGGITNDGTISAAKGVALLGKYVRNNGSITTTNEGGFVVMAAGNKVLLGEPGSNVLVKMNSVTTSDEGDGEVVNNGSVTSPAGTVVLAAGDIFSSALDLPKASGGTGKVTQNGTINADGTTGNGGLVNLTAADEVLLTSGSLTKANAGTGGDAGLVVAHSKEQTTVEASAQIQAIGGHTPYNISGDFDDVVDTTVEISGDNMNFAGDVDASATGGKRGKVVIDAFNMTVADGLMPDTPLDNTVYEKWIESQSYASTDVELLAHSKTEGNITVEQISDGLIEGGSGDIVFHTKYDTGGIAFLGDPATIHTTQGGNVYMLAGSGGITTGDIITDLPSNDKVSEPGKIRLLTVNNGTITTGQLSVTDGSYDEISVIASGNLTVNGNVRTITNQVPSETQEVGQARTCLVSEHGDVGINGDIEVEAHGKFFTTADIHIDAGQNITINLDGGQIRATAKTSEDGPANATVLIHAGKDMEGPGNILITDDGVNPTSRSNAIYLEAKPGGGLTTAQVNYGDDPSTWDEEQDAVYDEDGNLIQGAHAKLEVDNNRTAECPECPTPPGLVPPINPMGDPDAAMTHMGDPTSGNVLINDGSGLTVYSYTQPSHGTVELAENGDFVYTPDAGYADNDTPDSFTYITTDGELYSDPIAVTVLVKNSLPQAGDDNVATHMGDPIGGNVLGNDSDLDGDSLTVVLDGVAPQHGDLTLNEDGTFTYTPDAGYVGDDSFAYLITDGQIDGSNPVTVTATATISIGNNLPQAGNDNVATHMGDPTSGNVLGNDSDLDGDSLTVVLDGIAPQHGELTLNEDGTFTYTPDAGYVGDDSFAYLITDGQLDGLNPVTVTATATISVGNNLPQAGNDSVATHMGDPVGGNVLGNDSDLDGDSLMVVLDGIAPQHGELTLNGDGTFTYTPDAGYVGDDSFAYLITDGQLDGSNPVTVTATATINVGNNLPQAGNDNVATHMGYPVGGNVLGNDSDLDGDSLMVVLDGLDPQHGELTLNGDGTFTYTPDAGYVGDDSFAYLITDGQLDGTNPVTVTGTATITVANLLPVTAEDTATTNQGIPVVINVLNNDSDPDSDLLTVVVDGTLPQHGSSILNPDGTFTYTPDPAYVGEDSFTYAATDGQIGAELVWTKVLITINAALLIPAAPLPEDAEFEVSGCPALIDWTANEVGIEKQTAQIWMANALASPRDIQPCDACANLNAAATTVLQDPQGTYRVAMVEVINQYASSDAPLSEEQMALINTAVTNNTEDDNALARFEEYVDTLVAYVGILNNELDFTPADSITVATDKYIAPFIESDNVGLATYLAAKLTASEQ